ncbi:hypothetical protein BS50DRAFT_366390 [Corynespora cassiicola Philippines]|uniref:Uncharacterized protein n=1 Tax=Corynespora cassiicola Philippines TaxID=1448308 RepID=A0A2T2NSS0_CORCC|nr:hypothetical protein BS50DRAFT_366390 [Corynespora cassiicola Philippines]
MACLATRALGGERCNATGMQLRQSLVFLALLGARGGRSVVGCCTLDKRRLVCGVWCGVCVCAQVPQTVAFCTCSPARCLREGPIPLACPTASRSDDLPQSLHRRRASFHAPVPTASPRAPRLLISEPVGSECGNPSTSRDEASSEMVVYSAYPRPTSESRARNYLFQDKPTQLRQRSPLLLSSRMTHRGGEVVLPYPSRHFQHHNKQTRRRASERASVFVGPPWGRLLAITSTDYHTFPNQPYTPNPNVLLMTMNNFQAFPSYQPH